MSTLTRKVLPPPERALTSSVPLSCAGSNGLISATSRPGSVNANGIPVGDPQRGADQRDGVADVAGDVLARQPRDVAAERQRGLPELELAQLAEVHARVGGGDDLAGGLLDGLGELDRVGVGAALADRLVDRDLKRRRALVPGELLEQLAELLLLGEHLVVRGAAAQLGAAVDAEQPPVARLEP